jgi:hypothetical protein
VTGERDPSSTGGGSRAPQARQDPDRRLARLGLPESANELLAMLAFLTASDGPLRQLAATGRLDRRNHRSLVGMRRRIGIIGEFLRAREGFFIAAPAYGEGPFEAELALAQANLGTCRALNTVVERLLTRTVPLEAEFERMAGEALGIYSALEAIDSPATDGSS